MLKSDETLDFHNKNIEEVALGERCPNKTNSCNYILKSPLGQIYTNACPIGLHCVKLYGDANYDRINWDTKVEITRRSTMQVIGPVKQLVKWLQMYFSNPLRCKDIELQFCCLEEYGEFNSKVWKTIMDTCPAGQMMSYSELGQRSGYGPGASKVVGYAINKNPYMLVVGDHRVVKATGEIWCENDSQRNKLRRLLVKYEVSFTNESLEEALLRVKARNQASKSTRKRASSVKTEVKKEPVVKSGRVTKTKAVTGKRKAPIKKETAVKKRAGRRRRKDETSSEEEEASETSEEEAESTPSEEISEDED